MYTRIVCYQSKHIMWKVHKKRNEKLIMNVYYIMSWKCFIWHATSTQLRQKLETPQAIYVHGIENKWKRMQKDGRGWQRMGTGKPHFILKTLYAMTRLCALILMPNVGGPFFSVHAFSREFSFNLKRVLFTCRHRFLHSQIQLN